MTEIILTGAPGAGKTVLIGALERAGHPVVAEAATDVIALGQAEGVARPWEAPGFIAAIMALQQQRQAQPFAGPVRFHDRSLVCTHALARFIGVPVPEALEAAIAAARPRFADRVLFVGLLGFITPTAARRITLEEARAFEAVHRDSYRRFGFDIEDVPPGPIEARLAQCLGRV